MKKLEETTLEETVLKEKHSKLFYWLVKGNLIKYHLRDSNSNTDTKHYLVEDWKFNIFNPITDIILFIYLLLLITFFLWFEGFNGVRKQFSKTINLHVSFIEIKETEKTKTNNISSVPEKLETLYETINQGRYTAVERYLARVYNIRRHGEYYIQDYFTPENGYSYKHIWIIKSKWNLNINKTKMSSSLVYEKKETLINILDDIKSEKVSPIIKISLREILDKFELNNYNPGLIKIVKNKQEDKGFKYKHWDDEIRK